MLQKLFELFKLEMTSLYVSLYIKKKYFSALHSYIITYTKVKGIPGVEFTAVTKVDDQEVCYYDCNIKKLIPKQEWMKKTESEVFVKEVSERNNQTCMLFTKYTDYVKNIFSQTGGLS